MDPPQLQEGLRFYSSFDESLDADWSVGVPRGKGKYVRIPGRIGGAWNSGAGGVAYFSAANLDRAKGTLSFWIKPTRNLAAPRKGDPSLRFVLRTDVDQFRLAVFSNDPYVTNDCLLFQTGDTLPDGEHLRIPFVSCDPPSTIVSWT